MLCESTGVLSRDLARLERLLGGSGKIVLRCKCDPTPDYDKVQNFVRTAHLTSLVVAGTRNPGELSEVARVAESAGISRYAIQTVRLGVYTGLDDGSIAETWAMSVMTHVAKAAAASFAPIAKKVFSQNTSFDRRRLLFSFRDGLAEPVEDPVVVSDRCAPSHRTCRHCSDACHHSAISHAGPVVRIVHEKCVGCGACAAACPTGGLQPPAFSDDEYLALLREFGRRSGSFANPLLVFTCEKGIEGLEEEASSGSGLREGIVVVRVPCVAAVGWSHRVWSAAGNVPAMTVCPGRGCATLADAVLAEESARTARDSLEGSNRTLVAHRTIRAQESISEICAATGMKATRRPSDGQVPSGQRRAAIVSLPGSLFHSSPIRSRSLNTFEIAVNDRCVMCGMCSAVCPTKALRTEQGAGGPELRFFPSACIGCEICYWECRDHAIGISKTFSPSWLEVETYVVAAKDSLEYCRKCKKEIGPALNLKRVHDLLSKQGSKELAETVYLCETCKRSHLSNW